MSEEQEQRGYVMAEAVFAREEVEELALIELPAVLASVFAEFAGFAKNFLMGDRPRDAGDGEAEKQQGAELMRQRLIQKFWMQVYVTPGGRGDARKGFGASDLSVGKGRASRSHPG